MSGLLVAGTTSDAGKSVVTAGLCRWLARKGVKVAPFKAQNMSLNSMVTADGAEIGRAQYMQAQAAGVEARAVMNPVLLKPGSDRRSQVVVLGRPVADVDALQYGDYKEWLKGIVQESLAELRDEYDVVICEGAGSPAEINLRAGDIVNMGLARAAELPVVVVGDIDRGGVFASLYGTVALLEPEDQELIAGFVINKFRGATELLEPGLEQLRMLTGRPTLGVLPWKAGLYLDSEDTLALDAPRPEAKGPVGKETLRVAVVRFPRISNFTDLDALAGEPGVVVRYAAGAGDLAEADLVVLPGTRATVSDLEWLHERGMAGEIRRRADAGLPVLGICGGYQMLVEEIVDRVESGTGRVEGLGLLPARVEFGEEKILGRPQGSAYGEDVHAYEIHHGVVVARGEPFLDGCRQGAVWGTTWHGVMENDAFRRAFLRDVARQGGRDFTPAPDVSFKALREAALDTLADLVEQHLDTGAIWRIIENGAPRNLPVVPPGGPPEVPGGPPEMPGNEPGTGAAVG